MKKTLVSLFLALILALSLCLPAFAEDGRDFIDSTGRTVVVPETITRVAVSGPITQYIMLALAPEMMVGISTDWDASAAAFLPEGITALPNLGQLYGGKGSLNPEELLAAAPDVVIDVGEPKGDVAADMDALTEQTGIPFLHIDASLATYGDAFLKLGELLGKQAEAAVLNEYCNNCYARAQALAASVEKTPVLYLLGEEGLNVIAKGSYHGEVIDLMAENVAVLESPSSKGTGNEVDMEQLMNWDPEFILFAPGSYYAKAAGDPNWQNLKAIQNGRYAEAPAIPQNWISMPPTCQRYLALMWLGSCLYPDAANYDLYEEVKTFFGLFYHSELTQEQFAEITKNAFPAAK